jgi:hypothetical protein
VLDIFGAGAAAFGGGTLGAGGPVCDQGYIYSQEFQECVPDIR